MVTQSSIYPKGENAANCIPQELDVLPTDVTSNFIIKHAKRKIKIGGSYLRVESMHDDVMHEFRDRMISFQL